MKTDINKAIENISYNHHNQSSEVDFGYFDMLSSRKTVYIYTATCGMNKFKSNTLSNWRNEIFYGKQYGN